MIYRVEVKESHTRVVYVEADSKRDARIIARDPANWWDSEQPDTATDITVGRSVSTADTRP